MVPSGAMRVIKVAPRRLSSTTTRSHGAGSRSRATRTTNPHTCARRWERRRRATTMRSRARDPNHRRGRLAMRRARVRTAMLALVLAAASAAAPARAAEPGALEVDEIDHVFTTEAVPQPGSFRQDAGLVTAQAPAAAATEAPRKTRSIFGALST